MPSLAVVEDGQQPAVLGGMRATARGETWEVATVGPTWLTLRSLRDGGTQAAYYRGSGVYLMGADEVLFEVRLTAATRAALLFKVDLLVTGVAHAARRFEDRLTPSEREQAWDAIARSRAALSEEDVSDSALLHRLAELQRSGCAIGSAITREPGSGRRDLAGLVLGLGAPDDP